MSSDRDDIEGGGASTLFAANLGMTVVSRAVGWLADVVARFLSRTVAVMMGFIMMVLGLAMTATIVLLPAGVVIGLLGVAIFLGGIFAPDVRG